MKSQDKLIKSYLRLFSLFLLIGCGNGDIDIKETASIPVNIEKESQYENRVYDSEKFEVIGSEGQFKKIKLNDGTIGYIHESRVVKVNSDNTQYNSSNQNNKSVLLQTTKYKIRIDNLGNGNYTYTAWPASSAMNDTPNIVIKNGKRYKDGSGGNHYYIFTNGIYKYECWINVLGTDETPPANLLVYKNDDLILSQDAIIK